MEGLVRASPLVQHLPLRWIPNGVDLDVFRPVARAEARRELGLDPDRPVVYFSAPDLDDPRKGGALLEHALELLADLDFDLLVTGGRPERLPDRARFLGRVDDNPTLALTYAAADVFVLPTLADNLPNAVLESLACGTPCVAFAVGGVPDAVRHLETGWLARPGNVEELAEGIRALLQDGELRGRLAERARETAEREYAATLEADRFVDMYADVVGHA
jgi:glycosyltransferase involved in cell wall biosynthesis